MKKHVSIIFGIVFLLFMLVCTIFSRPIHDSRLAKVIIEKIRPIDFTVCFYLEDGTKITTSQKKLAIPIDTVHEGAVYVIRERERYNEIETYVELVYVKLGQIEGECVEVKQGLNGNDMIIIESDGPIKTGQTVLISSRPN